MTAHGGLFSCVSEMTSPPIRAGPATLNPLTSQGPIPTGPSWSRLVPHFQYSLLPFRTPLNGVAAFVQEVGCVAGGSHVTLACQSDKYLNSGYKPAMCRSWIT